MIQSGVFVKRTSTERPNPILEYQIPRRAGPSLFPLLWLAAATVISGLVAIVATKLLISETSTDPRPTDAANWVVAICWAVNGLLTLALLPLVIVTAIRRLRSF
jgi:hypothetical protein